MGAPLIGCASRIVSLSPDDLIIRGLPSGEDRVNAPQRGAEGQRPLGGFAIHLPVSPCPVSGVGVRHRTR